MSATPTNAVREIAVDSITPSPDNPRKNIDPAQLAELAQSIRAMGVCTPLTVRATDEPRKYEIVSGERRWRAAQMAGHTTVPAIVRSMTAAAAREFALVENLQRSDLAPADEAAAYEQLIARAADDGLLLDDEGLAQKTGKTVAYVRSRRKLLALIPEAREALAEQLISFGCALLIAKLTPADQEKATIRALDWNAKSASEALKQAREDRQDSDVERAEAIANGDGYLAEYERRTVTEVELRDWIEENVLLDLANAPWPLDSTEYGPACTGCPKRTGCDQALFSDLLVKEQTCTDSVCFGDKRKAFIAATMAAAERSGKPLLVLNTTQSYDLPAADAKSYKRGQWLDAKPGSCPHVRDGLTEDGELLHVCCEPKCKAHKHDLQAPQKRAKSGAKASGESWEEQAKRRKAAQAAYVERERPVREAVCRAVATKLRGAPLRKLILEEIGRGSDVREAAKLLGVSEASFRGRCAAPAAAELETLLAAIFAGRELEPAPYEAESKHHRDRLWALAKAAGVDADKIAAAAVAQAARAAASAPKAAVPPAAAKGAKGAAKAAKGRWSKLSQSKANAISQTAAKAIHAAPKPAKKGGKR